MHKAAPGTRWPVDGRSGAGRLLRAVVWSRLAGAHGPSACGHTSTPIAVSSSVVWDVCRRVCVMAVDGGEIW